MNYIINDDHQPEIQINSVSSYGQIAGKGSSSARHSASIVSGSIKSEYLRKVRYCFNDESSTKLRLLSTVVVDFRSARYSESTIIKFISVNVT